jgi:hypothetical protein
VAFPIGVTVVLGCAVPVLEGVVLRGFLEGFVAMLQMLHNFEALNEL